MQQRRMMIDPVINATGSSLGKAARSLLHLIFVGRPRPVHGRRVWDGSFRPWFFADASRSLYNPSGKAD